MLSNVLRIAWLAGAVVICCRGNDITGSWRLNVEKSKGIRILDQTMKVEKPEENSYHVKGESTGPSGTKMPFDFTRVCDRKEHPVEGQGAPPGTVESCDPQTLAVITKTPDGRKSEMKVSFSPDGRSHTLNIKRTMGDGKTVEEIAVYDRQ
jgi:hypothetical protein